ncbi:MAG: TIGR02281 family clan AA aspartic protease [Hyphomicrobiaceae bacterium]
MRFMLCLLLVAIAAFAYTMGSGTGAYRTMPLQGEVLWGLELQELLVLVAAVAVILIVLPGVLGSYRGRTGRAVRDILGWAVIAMLGVGAYNYRDELGQIAFRITGEQPPLPNLEIIDPKGGKLRSVRIVRRRDGHFVARVAVNGASVPMLVDTGASTVVLRQSDARKLGIDTTRLRFSVPVQTANGLAYAAPVRLAVVNIGNITLSNVEALVAQPGVLKESLLGMSFLSRLRSYEFSGQYLTFRN